MSRVALLAILLAVSLFAAPVLCDAPAVLLEEQSISATGVSPGARIVVFSIGKPPGVFMPVTARFEEMVVAEADGAISLELPWPVPERSVWAVVDLESGEFALAVPEMFDLRRVEFPGRGVGKTRKFLLDERRFLEVLLVRPTAAVPSGQDAAAQSGAWGKSFGDGGDDDGDGKLDGKIEAVLERLRPIGASPSLPPDQLSPGDVVVAIDPTTLEIYAATLAFGGDGQ